MTPGGDTRVVPHRVRRTLFLAAATLVVFVTTFSPAAAQDEGDPSKVGDLTGNLPFAVYLLIPLAIVLALLIAVVLGPRGDPTGAVRRAGGVTRVLTEREDSERSPT